MIFCIDKLSPQVRAATPMYLLARCVKAVGVKMVLSGEGSDEIFGG
jgi:asparagine synthase (glutamine-hydrolysing)